MVIIDHAYSLTPGYMRLFLHLPMQQVLIPMGVYVGRRHRGQCGLHYSNQWGNEASS